MQNERYDQVHDVVTLLLPKKGFCHLFILHTRSGTIKLHNNFELLTYANEDYKLFCDRQDLIMRIKVD